LSGQDAVPEPVIARPGKRRLALAHVHSKIGWERMGRRAVVPLVLLAMWQYACRFF